MEERKDDDDLLLWSNLRSSVGKILANRTNKLAEANPSNKKKHEVLYVFKASVW